MILSLSVQCTGAAPATNCLLLTRLIQFRYQYCDEYLVYILSTQYLEKNLFINAARKVLVSS